MHISIYSSGLEPINEREVEFVERKGIGHPDTLSDGIAEAISIEYSKYCMQNFNIVANHWVDKCMLIGGESNFTFNKGEIIYPIQILVVGKMTQSIGEHEIPIKDLAYIATFKYLKSIIPHIKEKDFKLSLFINSAIGAGRPNSWYRPSSVSQIKTIDNATANDAVICSAYSPLSKTEKLVLNIEKMLNSKEYKNKHPEIGTDIKVIANRILNDIHLTLCIPFIAQNTPSRTFYNKRKMELHDEIIKFASTFEPTYNYTVNINTRDDDTSIYMTYLGTAADTGDVGVVGRGNRMNGLISPCREMSIEAPCGKNPIYHSGKVYAVLAQFIADEIFNKLSLENYVNITSETGKDLKNPSHLVVKLNSKKEIERYKQAIKNIINHRITHIEEIYQNLLAGEILLY